MIVVDAVLYGLRFGFDGPPCAHKHAIWIGCARVASWNVWRIVPWES